MSLESGSRSDTSLAGFTCGLTLGRNPSVCGLDLDVLVLGMLGTGGGRRIQGKVPHAGLEGPKSSFVVS